MDQIEDPSVRARMPVFLVFRAVFEPGYTISQSSQSIITDVLVARANSCGGIQDWYKAVFVLETSLIAKLLKALEMRVSKLHIDRKQRILLQDFALSHIRIETSSRRNRCFGLRCATSRIRRRRIPSSASPPSP